MFILGYVRLSKGKNSPAEIVQRGEMPPYGMSFLQGLDMLMTRWEKGRGDGCEKNDLSEIPNSYDLDHTKLYSCLFPENAENLMRYFQM